MNIGYINPSTHSKLKENSCSNVRSLDAKFYKLEKFLDCYREIFENL